MYCLFYSKIVPVVTKTPISSAKLLFFLHTHKFFTTFAYLFMEK